MADSPPGSVAASLPAPIPQPQPLPSAAIAPFPPAGVLPAPFVPGVPVVPLPQVAQPADPMDVAPAASGGEGKIGGAGESQNWHPWERSKKEAGLIETALFDEKYNAFLFEAEKRAAFQIGLAYFRDANPILGSLITSLHGDLVIFLENRKAPNDFLSLLFTRNNLPCRSVPSLDGVTLHPRQLLLIGSDLSPSPDDLGKIRQFLQGGGLAISVNRSIMTVSKLFPGLVKYRNGASTRDKPIEVDISDTPDRPLLAGLENAALHHRAGRWQEQVHYEISDEAQAGGGSVTILAKEKHPRPSPLVVRFGSGKGALYHTSLFTTREMLEPRSLERTRFYVQQVQLQPALTEGTKGAWRAAFDCQMHGALYRAVSLLPFFDFIFGLMSRHFAPA